MLKYDFQPLIENAVCTFVLSKKQEGISIHRFFGGWLTKRYLNIHNVILLNSI